MPSAFPSLIPKFLLPHLILPLLFPLLSPPTIPQGQRGNSDLSVPLFHISCSTAGPWPRPGSVEEPSGWGLQDWFLALLGEVIHHAGAGTFPLGVPGARALSPFLRPRQGCACKEQPEEQGSLSLKVKSRRSRSSVFLSHDPNHGHHPVPSLPVSTW